MIDLHTHTTFSDGVLIPAELIRRAIASGYKGIALTDHADFSNFEFIIENQLKLKQRYKDLDFKIIVGIEITHVIPDKINLLAKLAKECGAEVVLVHGETIVEPVARGTNIEALKSEYVDILAHPGLITEDEVKLAKVNNKYLEITTRKGHSLTNGHVLKLAKKHNVKMLINNDAHAPSDFVSYEIAKKIVIGAGGEEKDFLEMLKNAEKIFQAVERRY